MTEATAFRPDHGRAWLVLLAAFFICFLSLGNSFTLSVLFNRIKQFTSPAAVNNNTEIAVNNDDFGGPTRRSINFIFSINIAVAYLTGTTAVAATTKIGYRLTILIGSVFICSGFALASFATNLWHLYLTLDLLVGFGVGLVFTPSVGLLASCFDKYRHFATTFASTGVATGITTFSFVHSYLGHTFPSWSDAMWIEALLCTPLLLLALIMVGPEQPDETEKSTTTIANGSAELDSTRLLDVERRNGPIIIKPFDGKSEDKLSSRVERFIDDMDEANAVEISALRRSSINKFKAFPINDVFTVPVAAVSTIQPKPAVNLFHFEMLRQSKFYFLLLEGLSIIGISVFMVATPAYLTESHGWSVTSAALVLTVHGCMSLICRAFICALNAVPSVGERIPKTWQAGWGILCITAAACAYMLTPSTITETISLESNFTSGPVIESSGESYNTLIFLCFAAVNGMGEAFFISYQASLLMIFMGGHRLTAALSYLTFVWGIAALIFLPTVGIIGDRFGSLRYAYALGIGCCLLSFCSLVVAVKLHRREQRQQSRI